jgi:hypothetical protein
MVPTALPVGPLTRDLYDRRATERKMIATAASGLQTHGQPSGAARLLARRHGPEDALVLEADEITLDEVEWMTIWALSPHVR